MYLVLIEDLATVTTLLPFRALSYPGIESYVLSVVKLFL